MGQIDDILSGKLKFDIPEQKEQDRGFSGHAQDAGTSLLKGVVSVPETAVGLLDIPTGGRVGKFIEESTPIQFKQAKEAIGEWHTDQYKEQQQKFNEAGQNEESLAGKVIEKGKVALQNPSMIANTVVESVPSMLAGGAIGRGLGMASKAISPIVGGAVGEGAVMAGAQAENIRYHTDDKLLTPEQSGAALATGALGSLFGFAGGNLAKRMGFDDINTAMASGRLNSQQVVGEIQKIPLRSIPKSIIGGALSEGLLEELPQSVSEQLLQNYALGKPLDEGVDSAIVMGTLAGMAMGGGMNTFSAPMDYVRNNRAYNEQQQEQQRQAQQRQQQEQQQNPSGFNQNPDAPNYENGIDYQPPQINSEPLSDNEVQPITDGIPYEPQQMHDTWSLGEDTQQDYGNSIEFSPLDSKASNLESQIQSNDAYDPDTPPAPNGNYFDDDYGSEAAFDDLLNAVPPTGQTPSQQMGINPNDGPMSSAAALAVDSGASPVTPQLGYAPEQQTQEQSNTPFSDVVPSSDQRLLGSQNNGQQAKSPVQDDEYFQSKLDQLDKQRTQFESSGDYANAEKVYTEMQTVAREWQTNSNTDTPTTKRAEPSKGASDNAWGDFYRKNRNMISEELFMGGHQDRNTLEEATPEIQSRHAHGMAKATPAASVRDLKDILENGIDQNRGQGRLFTAPLSQGKLTAEQRSAMSASGTSSGSAYSDGAFTLIAKRGVGDIRSVSEIDAVMVNSAVPQEVVNGLRQDFPNMKFGYAKELPSLLSGGKQSNNVQAQVAQLEQQFADAKTVSQKAQLRKQIAELQNGLVSDQSQGDVPPNNELQNNSDATQKNKAKNPVKDIALKGMATSILSGNRAEVQDMIEALGITEEEIASIQPDSKDNYLDRDFKYLPTADRVGVGSNQERAIYLPKTKGKKAQWQRIEDDYVLAMDGGRFVDLPKMTREQAIQLSNRDGENKYYDVVPRAYANHLGYKPVADIKNLADSTQETAPPNAAPNTEDLVSVTTTDGETHMVLASELNDSNVKNLTKFNAKGKRVAVKLSRSRIASTSEQNKQPKQGEATKTEATKTSADTVRAELKKLDNSQQSDGEVSQTESHLQENEVTHIEGKKSEKATNSVVEESLDKAEGNLTKAQYDKMRNELIADIEQAIAIAPNDSTEQITFDVKGDGKFKVHNNKAALSKFLKQVKANSGFKAPSKAKKSNVVSSGSFNAISSIKAMLTDNVDEYSIFNAYQIAQNADVQTIFVQDQGKVEPYFVVEQVAEVESNPLYLVLRKEKQGTSFVVVSQHGGRLGDSASFANKAKENGLSKINIKGQELILKALRGERERLKGFTQENLKAQFEQKMAEVFAVDMESSSSAIQNEDGIERIQDKRSDSRESIQDLGEKIGGARKDTALSTGKSKKTKSNDDRPTWAKRYSISEIVSSTNSNESGKWVIEDSKKTDWKGSPKKLGMFDSEQEAKDMLPVVAVGLKHRVYARRDGESGFEIWRQINDVKRVKVVNKVFDTKQDAQTYLIENANNILETSTTFGELDLPRPENTVRKGIERRKGDAKDTDFMKVFGFRGVEFGNWNNQEERQQLLNDAYDGLLDLAEVLKIPAKAISLNGDLALAFGARGQGLSSARAHYEPAKVVINLTKMNGAGSLAHEWWHAFDHYLARQDGIASAEWVVDADGTRSLKISNNSKDRMVSHGFSYRNSGVREDVRNAYTDLMKTMSTKAEQYVEDVQAVDKFVGQSRDRVKEQLDSLREDLSQQRDPKYYKRHNKPASAEQLVVFDTISQKLINGELLETEWRTDVKNKSASGIFSGARWTNDALEQLGEIYKSVRGRSGFSKDQDAVLDRLRSAMDSYANRLKMLADAQKEVSKTRKIPTKFVMDAKNLDEGRGSDYWTTPHELSARAFQGFVEDKITENNGRSPFLNHAPENAAIETPWGWVRPYPHGDERKAINAKFSDLVDTLKTEETETGIKLYSRNKLKPDEERTGTSPLDTTFTPLSVVSATRRVLSILEHLKIVTTQIDASVRGRIVVGWQRVGVNKVKGLDSHSFMVQVVESFDGLPSAIQEDNRYQGENGETKRYDVLGVWHNGTLYINAGDIQGNNSTQQTTFEMYEELILHEVVGHFGVQQIFGREYKTKLQQLFNALGGLEGIRKIAKDNGVDMQQFNDVYINPRMQAVKDEIYTESDVQQSLVGELFAFVAQNAKSRPFVRQKLKEVIGYIRQWFRDRGFDKFLSRYNDADLMMFLSEARKAVVDRSYSGKYKNQEFSSKNNSDTPLYSRSTKSNSGSTTQQVRDVLIDRFGKETIDELERQGKLEIIQDYDVDGIEGFYKNGKAVLVAANLTAESTVPTFLHELGGHAGFQNMMTNAQYNELMKQFDKLVEQGNPVAIAAKELAEREQGLERQQLEYLPYLLTLASTMQQKNVLQRNALQKLIRNLISNVKAWLFDKFSINLNLNPDDMVALAERMIDKAANNSINQANTGISFSQKIQSVFTDAFTIAKDEQQRIAKDIDRLIESLQSYPQPVQMKMPPVLLALDGVRDGLNVQDLPLELDRFTLRKMTGQVDGKKDVSHQLTLEQIKQLPNELANPLVILQSDDGRNLTIVTAMQDPAGNPVISAIHLNKQKGKYVINELATTFGRERFMTWLEKRKDKVIYSNSEKSKGSKYPTLPHFLGQLETAHVGVVGTRTSTQTILTPDDVVNFFEQQHQPLYSRKSFDDVINNLSESIKNLSAKSVKDKAGYKWTDWLGVGLQALGRRQLTEIYSKLLPQLNKYNDLAAQMDADKNDAGAKSDSIAREWSNLRDEDQLAEVMHDSTLAKIDPSKPYVSGDNITKYNQLRDAYKSLSPEAQAMYVKARDAYKKHYAKVHQAIKERILRSELSSQKKADLLKQMDDNFFGYVKGVYFPLARFGKYVVVMRNQNGEVESVSRAETMGEAQSLRSELMQKYPHYKTDRVVLDKEFNASRDAVGRGFMTNLFAEVDNLGLSTAEQAEFEDTLSQLYLSSMPDLSWAKHGIHRKGTAGFSQDARRAFAQNMFHGAGYLAKLRYGDQLAQQLDDMQKYASEQSKLNDSYDQPTAQRVIDEMNKRHDNLMNPKSHPLSSALTSLGFIYYLGLSPAAAMVNLSQTALVAYPIMGAKWGFDKAANELLKASNDFRKGVEFHKVKWEGSKTDLYKTISSDISKFLNKDEKQAYEDAVARGVIDVTQAHDLAGIAQGEDSGIMWKTRPIMRAASVMFHSAERFNREVTFIAAYRLARQSGEKHDSAFDQAVDATYRGHFDYSSGNRPRIMQGNVAKVLLLFKQFGQNMVYTLARQTYQSIKGETKAERKEARKSLAAILAMHATFAGTLGLPMVGMLLSLASWAGGDDDDPWDAEVALRNYLAEAFGPTISTLLMKGAPRAFTPFDMSGRVGINNMLLPDVQEGLEGKRWAESAMAGALGPVAGIGTNLVKGGQDITEGQTLRGIETMLPVFLKNFAKTYRYADEGVQDKTGVSIVDEVSSMDLLVQGMGFSPSDVRTANEGKSAIYQLNRKLNERRSRLMTLWSRAKMMDDQQEMDEIWEEIQGFNDKNPSRRITRMNLNQSYRNRQRRIDRAEDGIYLPRNRQDAREAGYFAFGE